MHLALSGRQAYIFEGLKLSHGLEQKLIWDIILCQIACASLDILQGLQVSLVIWLTSPGIAVFSLGKCCCRAPLVLLRWGCLAELNVPHVVHQIRLVLLILPPNRQTHNLLPSTFFLLLCDSFLSYPFM